MCQIVEERSKLSFDSVAVVIGLEVHVQLQTQTKLFCGCSTRFGAPPNQQTCPICTGMPGVLPVLNQRAIELALRAGLALGCEVSDWTKWDRKNYFYPDLPKGYQTSQYDLPICGAGHLDFFSSDAASTRKTVNIERAHLEEDAGKSLHDESGNGGTTMIDLNRAGTPLLEIVTRPDLRSSSDAKTVLQELRLLLTYLEVSDCNMQEGSLRCDANVNLHIPWRGDQVATPITEIKNLNSFRGVERAIEFESRRQFAAWQADGLTIQEAPKQTRGWNDSQTYLQRDKEDSADYRYFPCPDLIGYRIDAVQLEKIRRELPELPQALRERLEHEFGLSKYDADVIVGQGRGVLDYFFTLAHQVANKKLIANWIIQEVLRHLNEVNQTIDQYPVAADQFADLLNRIDAASLDPSRAKDVLHEMLAASVGVADAIARLGIVTVDDSQIKVLAQQLIAENQSVIAEIKAGNLKAMGALIGKARKINPNANPAMVKDQIMKIVEQLD